MILVPIEVLEGLSQVWEDLGDQTREVGEAKNPPFKFLLLLLTTASSLPGYTKGTHTQKKQKLALL